MIAVFLRREDKISILRDRDLRYELRQGGVKVSADFTVHQREQIAYYKSQGKFAYYKNGKLQVENRNYQRNGKSRFMVLDPMTTTAMDNEKDSLLTTGTIIKLNSKNGRMGKNHQEGETTPTTFEPSNENRGTGKYHTGMETIPTTIVLTRTSRVQVEIFL
ncbi:hypothetical protein ACOMHN_007697 [Nucella lapillus]